MFDRSNHKTNRVAVGDLFIGGGEPISVQSMTNTDTRDIVATLAQIAALKEAGCEIVRCTVSDMQSAYAMRHIVEGAGMPVVADVHFDHTLGIAAIEQGVSKLRINPGNIGSESNVDDVAACAKAHKVPIRIGVNSGSVERELLQKYGGPTPQAMLDSAMRHVLMLEKRGFTDIIVSLKASSAKATIAACRLFASACDYPQHIGVTEAGTLHTGTIKSAVGIGTLLMEGIGDTIRVSLTGNPVPEIEAGLSILRACGLRNQGIEIISCPTCGRCCIDVEAIANELEIRLAHIKMPLTVAVMGCVVNGPGEAREADLGIAGGPDAAALFIKGQPSRRVEKNQIVSSLLEEIERLRILRGDTQTK